MFLLRMHAEVTRLRRDRVCSGLCGVVVWGMCGALTCVGWGCVSVVHGSGVCV